MKLRWSEEAASTVDEIIVDVATRSGKARARKLADDLAAHLSHLEAHPQMGRMVPELQRPDVRSSSRVAIGFSTSCASMRSRCSRS